MPSSGPPPSWPTCAAKPTPAPAPSPARDRPDPGQDPGRTPTPPRRRPTRAPKPPKAVKEPGLCVHGCGQRTERPQAKFVRGHDSLLAQELRAAYANGEKTAEQVREHAGLISEKFLGKMNRSIAAVDAQRAAETDAARARKALLTESHKVAAKAASRGGASRVPGQAGGALPSPAAPATARAILTDWPPGVGGLSLKVPAPRMTERAPPPGIPAREPPAPGRLKGTTHHVQAPHPQERGPPRRGRPGRQAWAGTFAATAAGASTTHGTVTATTRIIQRYDGGGAGNWAVDSFTRKLTLTYLGKSGDPAHPYAYTAYLADDGGFTDLPGQLTPNQGGQILRQGHGGLKPVQVAGSMTGYAQWNVFDASTKAVRGLVPTSLRGLTLNANSAYSATSTWPELAFQSGTTFAGVNLGELGLGLPRARADRDLGQDRAWPQGHRPPGPPGAELG